MKWMVVCYLQTTCEVLGYKVILVVVIFCVIYPEHSVQCFTVQASLSSSLKDVPAGTQITLMNRTPVWFWGTSLPPPSADIIYIWPLLYMCLLGA